MRNFVKECAIDILWKNQYYKLVSFGDMFLMQESKRTYLSWIDDASLLYEIEDIAQFVERMVQSPRPKRNHGDPLKELFEQSLFGRTENLKQRRAMNALSSSLFHFHEEILASSGNNWAQIGSIDSFYRQFDLVNSNTMEFAKFFRVVSASLDSNFREIVSAAADPKINKIYLVGNDEIFHRFKRFRSQNQKIYEVKLEDFYTVVTGVNDALYQLYAILPKLIKEISTKQVFISYSHHDNDHMEKVRDAFRSVDIAWWVDENLIPGTADWMRAIQKAIEECGCLIVILSPHAKSSKWVSEEIEYATSQEKRIVPFLVSGNEQNAVPFGITKVQRIDATKDYPSAISKLTLTIKDYLRDLRGT